MDAARSEALAWRRERHEPDHTAIQETEGGKSVEWLERVTDEQYTAPAH